MAFVRETTTRMQQVPTGGLGQCDVCTRLDRDFRAKPVTYCSLCKAYLCPSCQKSPVRRARAAALKAIGR